MLIEVWSHISSFVIHNGVQIFWTIFVIAIILMGKIIFSRFFSRGVKDGVIPNHVANILSVLTNIAAIIIFFLTGTVIWKVQGSWLVGGLGISAGTIIGLASSETIGNAISGFIILFSRPFQIGHRIRINNYLGDVEKITLTYTTIISPNLEEINIPNRRVLNAEVMNYGMGKTIRISISCTVDYSVNLNQFKQRLLGVPFGLNGVADTPKPLVRVTNLGKFSAEFTLYVFTFSPVSIPQLESDLRERIWRMYSVNGIGLTTPTLIQSVPISPAEVKGFNQKIILEAS